MDYFALDVDGVAPSGNQNDASRFETFVTEVLEQSCHMFYLYRQYRSITLVCQQKNRPFFRRSVERHHFSLLQSIIIYFVLITEGLVKIYVQQVSVV